MNPASARKRTEGVHNVHPLSAASARKQRYRALQRAGGAVLRTRIEDYFALVELLLATHWLSESESEDRAAVEAALSAMVNDLVASQRREP